MLDLGGLAVDLLALFRTLSGSERAGLEGLQEAGVNQMAATLLVRRTTGLQAPICSVRKLGGGGLG